MSKRLLEDCENAKRQKLEEFDSSLLIPVIDYIDFNTALSFRCVSHRFAQLANQRIRCFAEKLSDAQAYNLGAIGILSPLDIQIHKDVWPTFVTELYANRLSVSPYLKKLGKLIDFTYISSHFLLWRYGHCRLSAELYLHLELHTKPNLRHTLHGPICKELHENWNTLSILPDAEHVEVLIDCISPESILNIFPVLYRTAVSRCELASLFGRCYSLPFYFRKSVVWPERNCLLVQRTQCWKSYHFYLEFFVHTPASAHQWLRHLYGTHMLVAKLACSIVQMLEIVYSIENVWVVSSPDDLNLIQSSLSARSLEKLQISKTTYWALREILAIEKWQGEIRFESH